MIPSQSPESREPTQLGEVIAQRAFDLEVSAGTHRVVVQVGKPVRGSEQGRLWYCPAVTEGLGAERFDALPGIDSLGSLLASLNDLRVMLPHYAEQAGGTLSFLSQSEDILFASRINEEKYLNIARSFLDGLRETLSVMRMIVADGCLSDERQSQALRCLTISDALIENSEWDST
jgi:hypothetical protein